MIRRTPFSLQILPFISLGIFIVLGVLSFIFLSYLILAGALLGLILFVITFIKSKFFPSKQLTPSHRKGRTFDHDEFN